MESIPCSVFAIESSKECPVTDEQIAQALKNATFIDATDDSSFHLINTHVDSSDEEYFPETADMDEHYEYELSKKYPTDTTPKAASSNPIPGDAMVYYTQKWLNQQYGNISGFVTVTEDGRTGNNTVKALARALQYELGISPMDGSFGSGSIAVYNQNPLHRQDGITDRKFAILQGALWCKGYCPGYNITEEDDGTIVFNEVFDANVEQAIIELQQDAGLSNADGVVSGNIMKALLTMDTFKLLTSYGGKPEIREMQQKLNRKYEYYTGLMPCDGVYAANTNRALIKAFQAEEGFPKSAVDGLIGTSTKQYCPQIPYAHNSTAAKSYSGTYYTDSQISSFTELLQFALMVNGFYSGSINGIFNSQTQQSVRNCQKEFALPETGMADMSTWMALLISSGDTSRKAIAADCAKPLTVATAQTLADNGYKYIGRYLTGTYSIGNGQTASKALTKEEAQIIFNAGLRFFPIFQGGGTSSSYFTEERGIEDAQKAITAAQNLGLPKDTIIYFAVDFDALDYQITSNILPYFKKVHDELSGSAYKTGIYGVRNVCTRVSNQGYACSSFVADSSTGFSGNLGYPMPNNWAFDQFKTDITIGTGAGALGIDKDGVSGRDLGVCNLNNSIEYTLSGIKNSPTETDTLYGPVIRIGEYEFPLFALDVSLNTPNGIMFDTEFDNNENQINVIIGLDLVQYSKNKYGIREKPKGAKYRQAYTEVKSLVSVFGKNKAESLKKLQDFKGSLYDSGFKCGFEFDGYCVGYMTIDFNDKSGIPKLIEGEMGIIAKADASWKWPTPIPLVFAKLEIEGTLETGLNFILQDNGDNYLVGHAGFSIQPSFAVGVDAVVANAYAGISGSLECESRYGYEIESTDQAFKANLNASVFFEINAFMWGNRWDWVFQNYQLYPPQASSQNLSLSSEELEFIPPTTHKKNMIKSSNPNVFKEDLQIYCHPQIVNLGNDRMFMLYIDDTNNRTNENRTILMYSVFDGTDWREPQPVCDDGTVDFEPSICYDGNGGVHIVWQNGITTFDENVTLDAMSTGIDLFYTHWNGNEFENTTAITSNNQDMEMAHKVASSGNNIAVVWEQNSDNESISLCGTNSIYRRQFVSGAWQNIENIVSGLPNINSMDTTFIGINNVVAYTTKSTDVTSTISDSELYYYNGTQPVRLTNDNIADCSVNFLNNELYWLSGSSIVRITDGNMNTKEVIAENLDIASSRFKAIDNLRGNKSIVWEEDSKSESMFFCINYNPSDNSFGNVEPLSIESGLIRGWDVCMNSDGQIETAYCHAEYLDEPIDNKPYGNLNLKQKAINRFYNISINPDIYYDGNIVESPNLTIHAEIYNSGSLSVTQYNVKIYDEADILLQESTIANSLSVGESVELEIPFNVPTPLRADYKISVLPIDGNDLSTTDNTTTFSTGFSDVSIENIEEVRTEFGRQIKTKIKNKSFNPVSNATVKLLEDSADGNVLAIEDLSSIGAFSETELTFNVSESYYSENPKMFYITVEIPETEDDYSNNNQMIYVYPDYTVSLNAGTGGNVSGSGTFERGSKTTLLATPNSGYLFDGWYENNQLIYGADAEYEVSVESNRVFEAAFKANDLTIDDIEIFGTLEIGETLNFTAITEGGQPQYNWDFYIYSNGTVFHREFNSKVKINFFTYQPLSSGTYTVVAYVTDSTGFRTKLAKQFTIV